MSRMFHLALAAVLSGFAFPAWAASLQVAPTTIDLPAKGGNAVLYVSNNGATPIGVHIEGFAWSQQDGADRLEPSKALQLSPPMTRLKPGERQSIRLRVKPQKGAGERTFRLVASELPDATDHLRNGVRVLFQFSVPVFAGKPGGNPKLAWHLSQAVSGVVLTAGNTGSTYAKFSGVKLVPPSGAAVDVSHGDLVYILAGASQHWNLGPVMLTPGEKLEAYDDRNRRAIEVPVAAAP